MQPTRSAISAGGTFCATSVGINASTASVKIGFLIAWPHRMLARVARCRNVSYCGYSQPKAAEPPLWLANGSASGKAQKVFCYYDCYLKPPDRPGLVISSQSLVPAAHCRADSFFQGNRMLRPDRFIASCASWSEFWEGTKRLSSVSETRCCSLSVVRPQCSHHAPSGRVMR